METRKEVTPNEKKTVYEGGDLKIVAAYFEKFALVNVHSKEIGEIVQNSLNELGKYDLGSHFREVKTDKVPVLWYEKEKAKDLDLPTSGLPISANTAFLDEPGETWFDRQVTVIVSKEFDWEGHQEVIDFALVHELAHALLEAGDRGEADGIADEIVSKRRGKEFKGGENVTKKEYTLHLHWKQGSDFADELERADTVPEALLGWAERFEKNAEHCRELADEFDGEDVEADATVHHIEFYGDEEILKKAVEKKLIGVVELTKNP